MRPGAGPPPPGSAPGVGLASPGPCVRELTRHMIRRQTLTYNRTRQAQITKELIEIISGAEAL